MSQKHTTRERFYDNVTTFIHDVNLNVTDDKKNHTFTNFSIKCKEGIYVKIYIYI